MRAVICGGRDYKMLGTDYVALDRIHGIYKITEVVSGCQTGADQGGESWAKARGIPVKPFPYEKSKGRAGGPIRNEKMAKYAREDNGICVAFPGGRGTTNMITRAEYWCLPVIMVDHGQITWDIEGR